MKAAFVIEDNFIKVAYQEHNGKTIVHKQSKNKSEYESTFILEDNFCYTTKTLENVKLANPKLNIFTNILSEPRQTFITSKGDQWNNRQLTAILFKKILHDINTNSIEAITSAVVALAPDVNEEFQEDLDACIKANGVLSTSYSTYGTACQKYTKSTREKQLQQVVINLSMEKTFVLGEKKITVDGFGYLDQLLITQLEEQNAIRIDQFSETEKFLISEELKKININVLNKIGQNEYIILLNDRYLNFKVPFLEIENSIEERLNNVKESLSDCIFDVLIITGRMMVFPLIGETCRNLFTDKEFENVILDTQNEIKSRGLLVNQNS